MRAMESIKRIRERLGLSQKRLAEALDIAQTTLSLYERGGAEIPSPKAQLLINQARIYGLTIDFNHVYGGVDLPPEPAAKAAPAPTERTIAPPTPAAAFPPISRRKVVR